MLRNFAIIASLALFAPTLAGCKVDAVLDLPEIDLELDFHGIAQAVPPDGSENVPARAPVIIFADGVYADVDFTVEAEVNGEVIDLTAATALSKVTSGAAKDIFILTPLDGFPLGALVTVTLAGEIDRKVSFRVSEDEDDSPADPGFETPSGWTFVGDAGTIDASGSLTPSEGSRLLALSTGELLGGEAVTGTSSYATSAAMDPGGATTLSLTYTFLSSEFDDYCASDFDDTFLVVATGPEGSRSVMIDSVNVVCKDGRQSDASFEGLPDGGDEVVRGTAATPFSLDIADLGSPIAVTFVVTDVGDAILSTLVGVDGLAFE